ncbi:MAG: bifunctional metallophosphatase/5'-nucleotidase [Halioglobus sp.]
MRRRLSAGLLTLACSAVFGSTPGGDVQDELVFIHMNDLHANLTPHRDLVRENGSSGSRIEVRGGLARIAGVIQEIRAENPNSVLMNIGDTYHGGVEALYSRGNAIIAPVNALGIDIGVPGNWDFAYGPITTRLRYTPQSAPLSRLVNQLLFGEPVETPEYPLLGGNVTTSLPLLDQGKPLLPATRMITLGDYDVGFIGITSDIIPRMSSMLAIGFDFLQGEQAYRDYINTHASTLKQQGADVVVVMSELGLHKDWQLANGIDVGVDVIFSAHTHEVTTEPLQSTSGALVVEAGNDGLLGVMSVSINEDGLKHYNWSLLEIHAEIEPDPEVMALVEKARAPFLTDNPDLSFAMPGSDMLLSEPITSVIGSSPGSLHRRHAVENPFNQFLSQSLRSHYSTDLAITPGFRFDAVVPAGEPMTVEDTYRYLPVPPVLARGVITGKALRELLEFEINRSFSADAFDHSGGWLLGLSGVALTLDLTAVNGHRVLSMQREGDATIITDADELSVVSCQRPFDASDALCGNRGFDNIQTLESPWGTEWTAREFLQWRIKHGGEPLALDRLITDVSGTLLWPESDYIQPLHHPKHTEATQ